MFAGAFERDFAYAIRDAEGLRFGDELERIGYRGDIPCRPRPLAGGREREGKFTSNPPLLVMFWVDFHSCL